MEKKGLGLGMENFVYFFGKTRGNGVFTSCRKLLRRPLGASEAESRPHRLGFLLIAQVPRAEESVVARERFTVESMKRTQLEGLQEFRTLGP